MVGRKSAQVTIFMVLGGIFILGLLVYYLVFSQTEGDFSSDVTTTISRQQVFESARQSLEQCVFMELTTLLYTDIYPHGGLSKLNRGYQKAASPSPHFEDFEGHTEIIVYYPEHKINDIKQKGFLFSRDDFNDFFKRDVGTALEHCVNERRDDLNNQGISIEYEPLGPELSEHISVENNMTIGVSIQDLVSFSYGDSTASQDLFVSIPLDFGNVYRSYRILVDDLASGDVNLKTGTVDEYCSTLGAARNSEEHLTVRVQENSQYYFVHISDYPQLDLEFIPTQFKDREIAFNFLIDRNKINAHKIHGACCPQPVGGASCGP